MYFCEKKMISAEIISIGNELLNGKTINTNSVFIAQLLEKNNVSVDSIHAISDSKTSIFNSLSNIKSQTKVVVVTGGLGPTNDDITKVCISEFFNSPLIHNDIVLQNIIQLFNNKGFELTEINKKQALVPDKANFIINDIGTAPGLVFFENSKLYIFLPGVPFEMKKMAEDNLIDIIFKFFKADRFIFYKDFVFIGLGESFIYESLLKNSDFFRNSLDIAFLPSPGLVKLRVKVVNNINVIPDELFDYVHSVLIKLFPNNLIGLDEENIALVLQKLFIQKNKSFAVAESCTGGFISSLITSNSNSSEWFKGGIVAYSNEIKINFLNVNSDSINEFGAVSESVVTQMALNSTKIFNTDYALSISGIAGPNGGTPTKPVGTIWIAVATKNKAFTKLLSLGNSDRQANIQRAANLALLFLLEIFKNYDN